MPEKLILAACVTGLVTSRTAARKIRKIAAQRKWQVDVRAVDFRQLGQVAASADALVLLAPRPQPDYGAPILSGLPFLTGFGLEKAVQELEGILNAPLDNPAATWRKGI